MKLLILLALVAAATAQSFSKWDKFDNSPKDWTTWSCPLPRIGLTPECPAVSCKRILDLNPFAHDGKYWFRINGILFEAFCDMTNGGFMTVVRFPKCWIPEMRFDETPNEIVTKPHTIWEMLDTVIDFNEGKLDNWMNDWWLNVVYKNRAWRHWDLLDVKRVRVSFWKNHRVAKALEFNAVGADRWSWFTWERMVKSDFSLFSSWNDIKNTTHDWPLFAWRSPWHTTDLHREFLLMSGLNRARTCNQKLGWFWGVNNIKAPLFRAIPKCNWETTCNGVHFLFSKLDFHARFNVPAEIEMADSVTISFQ